MEVEVVVDDVSDGLCVCGRPRPTAVDRVCYLSQLVGYPVSDVSPATQFIVYIFSLASLYHFKGFKI